MPGSSVMIISIKSYSSNEVIQYIIRGIIGTPAYQHIAPSAALGITQNAQMDVVVARVLVYRHEAASSWPEMTCKHTGHFIPGLPNPSTHVVFMLRIIIIIIITITFITILCIITIPPRTATSTSRKPGGGKPTRGAAHDNIR